jgi:hypothetical protein
VQYSRAIKHYVKKFGRYPTRIEELEDTNNMRFLRKRYKDPITGKDFKILHMGDVQMGMGGGTIAGATPVSTLAAAAGAGNNSGFGNNSAFGGNNGAFGGNSAFGGNNGTLGGSNSSFGGNNGAFGATPSNNTAPAPGTDPSQVNAGSNPDQSAPAVPGTQTGNGQLGSAQSTNAGQNQVFGGGPMVGVASTSKDKTIRIFNKKEHYNEWQFIYDPTTDRGGLLTTPNQPGLQSLGGNPQMQGMTGTQGGTQGGLQGGTQNSPFGSQSSPFGSQPQPGGIQPVQQQQPTQSSQPQFPPDQGP